MTLRLRVLCRCGLYNYNRLVLSGSRVSLSPAPLRSGSGLSALRSGRVRGLVRSPPGPSRSPLRSLGALSRLTHRLSSRVHLVASRESRVSVSPLRAPLRSVLASGKTAGTACNGIREPNTERFNATDTAYGTTKDERSGRRRKHAPDGEHMREQWSVPHW